MKELIALAKAKPGSLNYASSGAGGIVHLGTEYFKSMAGVDIVHIPYKGGNTAHNDLVAGFVQVYFGTILSTLPVVKSGKLRALGVSTDKRNQRAAGRCRRSPKPACPASRSAAGTRCSRRRRRRRTITTLLNREIVALLQAPDVKERLAAEGSTVVASTPEAVARRICSAISRNGRRS